MLSEFPSQGNGPEAKRHECNECMRARYRSYYKKDRSYYRTKAAKYYMTRTKPVHMKDPDYLERRRQSYRRYNQRKRGLVLDHYGRQCVCCGEAIDRFLTIDHINSDGSHRRKDHGSGLDFYRWIIKNDYPSDLQTLCFNCNLGRALNGGVCPHEEGSETIPKGSRAKRPQAPSIPSG